MFHKKVKEVAPKQPWREYKLLYEWDYQTATHEYRLYQYEIIHFSIYSGATGGWVVLGTGNKAWAQKNVKQLNLKLPIKEAK